MSISSGVKLFMCHRRGAYLSANEWVNCILEINGWRKTIQTFIEWLVHYWTQIKFTFVWCKDFWWLLSAVVLYFMPFYAQQFGLFSQSDKTLCGRALLRGTIRYAYTAGVPSCVLLASALTWPSGRRDRTQLWRTYVHRRLWHDMYSDVCISVMTKMKPTGHVRSTTYCRNLFLN